MRSPASIRTWGPSPLYAVPAVVVAIGAAGWAWSANRGPLPAPSAVEVTAMKPVAGDLAAELPLAEVAFGVPSERTLHLWRPFWPPVR
jgi:hypothetical protein